MFIVSDVTGGRLLLLGSQAANQSEQIIGGRALLVSPRRSKQVIPRSWNQIASKVWIGKSGGCARRFGRWLEEVRPGAVSIFRMNPAMGRSHAWR